jgi:hypothetical protein
MNWRSIVDVLAKDGLGWSIVLALLIAETATVLSLLLTIRHTRTLSLGLKEARQSLVSLRNSVGRLSRELRIQQELYRSNRPSVDVEEQTEEFQPSTQSRDSEETNPTIGGSDGISDPIGDPPDITSEEGTEVRTGRHPTGGPI